MPIKILVVDDEPDLEQLIRQKFRRAIRDNEYTFLFARSGADALTQLQSDGAVDLVLTDINMPEMDGLTLLGRIEEMKAEALKSVVVSAYGDMDNIRVAMNRGAFDFVTKPIDLNDLETTIQKALREVSTLKEALHMRDALVSIRQELNIASEIQMSMLPRTFPPFPERREIDIFARMVPATEVGGDLYDFFVIDDHRVGFTIGDVSGKGVPAALLMAISRTLLKEAGQAGLPPDECLAAVNRILVADTLPQMFVTVLYGVLDTRSGEVEFCSGGHNLPYLLANGHARTVEGKAGLPVGVMDGLPYARNRITLAPGDTLFLYTDGVTEARDINDRDFGDQRLEELLSGLRGVPADGAVTKTIEAVQNFSAGVPQADDITCLAVRFLGS